MEERYQEMLRKLLHDGLSTPRRQEMTWEDLGAIGRRMMLITAVGKNPNCHCGEPMDLNTAKILQLPEDEYAPMDVILNCPECMKQSVSNYVQHCQKTRQGSIKGTVSCWDYEWPVVSEFEAMAKMESEQQKGTINVQ